MSKTKNIQLNNWKEIVETEVHMIMKTKYKKDWSAIYGMLNLLGKNLIAHKIISEGTSINLWTGKKEYFQFVFYSDYTLVNIINVDNNSKESLIEKKDIEEDNLFLLDMLSILGAELSGVTFECVM